MITVGGAVDDGMVDDVANDNCYADATDDVADDFTANDAAHNKIVDDVVR